MSYQYDAAGRMTRITWPDAFYVAYDHDLTGAVTAARANGATSGAGVLATYGYSDLGQLTGVTRGNGATSAYGYDAHARLTSLSQNPAGTAADLALSFGYNPAGQIATRTVGTPAYAFASTGGQDNSRNGLNQLTVVNAAPVTYDANGNTTGLTTATGASTYGYDPANRLISATSAAGPGASTFSFDPLNRLATTTTGSAATRFQYAGVQLTAEYDGSGTLTRRHIPGLGLDGVIASYMGSGTTAPSWLLADERGSVIALTDGSGTAGTINRYDDYGVPATGNAGRFQYTGQAWLAEAQAYHYRARTYLPQTGRFLQSDPIGYAAGMNLYGYVGQDPMNLVDPMGLEDDWIGDVKVVGSRLCPVNPRVTTICDRSEISRLTQMMEDTERFFTDSVSRLDDIAGVSLAPAYLDRQQCSHLRNIWNHRGVAEATNLALRQMANHGYEVGFWASVRADGSTVISPFQQGSREAEINALSSPRGNFVLQVFIHTHPNFAGNSPGDRQNAQGRGAMRGGGNIVSVHRRGGTGYSCP